MAQVPTIPTILQTAKQREYLSFNSNAKNLAFITGTLDQRWPEMIYGVRKSVQWLYDLSPSDPTLLNTSDYLWSLVAPAISVVPYLINITLTAMAVSSTEIDLAWTFVPNATQYILEHSLDQVNWTVIFTGNALTFPDTGLTPSTHYFYRIHATAPGFTDSPYAFADATTLPVVTVISISWYYGDTDFSAALAAGTDAVPYQGAQNITHNAPFTITWPAGAANNQFQVIRVPITESIKTFFDNTPLNQGPIPGPEYLTPLTPAGLPSFYYICSRTAISLQGTTLTETFS